MKAFLSNPTRGRPLQQKTLIAGEDEEALTEDELHHAEMGYVDLKQRADTDGSTRIAADESSTGVTERQQPESDGRTVDVVLSDMSAPWEQTTGFWKRSLSDPYYRMMNTSGMSFRDHAGSMVRADLLASADSCYTLI